MNLDKDLTSPPKMHSSCVANKPQASVSYILTDKLPLRLQWQPVVVTLLHEYLTFSVWFHILCHS